MKRGDVMIVQGSTDVTAISASKPTRRWLRWLVRLLIVLFLAALLAGGWFAYHCATVALRAEENLHASLFTIRLVSDALRRSATSIRFRVEASIIA